MSSHAQARLRILKTLDNIPDAGPGTLTIILDGSGAPASRLSSRFVEHLGAGGIKVEITTALGAGTVVGLAGQLASAEGPLPVLGQFRVLACLLSGIGKYHANLAPHAPEAESQAPRQARRVTEGADCYEILQVSRTADIDTIHRVFHLLAQRYHPDNRVTGDDDKFRQVVEAHGVLSNPERRAAHDIELVEHDRGRHKIFESLESTQGVAAEIRKRQGILRLLYNRRLTNPRDPVLRGRDFVEMLGCPAEHLEFALWFLKENKFLQRADNNSYEITWQGVEAFETQEQGFSKKQPLPLPAPAL